MKKKYTIKTKLQKMPGSWNKNFYGLCIHIDVTHNTLIRWMGLPAEERASIPSDELYLIAEFLECTPIELLNR